MIVVWFWFRFGFGGVRSGWSGWLLSFALVSARLGGSLWSWSWVSLWRGWVSWLGCSCSSLRAFFGLRSGSLGFSPRFVRLLLLLLGVSSWPLVLRVSSEAAAGCLEGVALPRGKVLPKFTGR